MTYDLSHGEVSYGPGASCWICFGKHGSRHNHHVIPQASGGTDGPQVHICAACHDAIHDAAKVKLEADEYMLLPSCKRRWNTVEARQRASFLIRLIVTAEAVTSSSENKTIKIGVTLSGELNKRLEYIARRMKVSKQEAIKKLIAEKNIY